MAALWVVAVVSVAALQFGLVARSQRLAMNNRTELLRARIAAEGALEVARERLAGALDVSSMPDPWHGVAMLAPDTLYLSDVLVVTRIVDAGSMLHPLGLRARRLVPFFLAVGGDSTAALLAAEYVADSPSARGAILLQGCPGSAQSDLSREADASVDFWVARALPMMLCVGALRVNVRTAPAPVLMSLPGMSDAAVAALIQRRSAGRWSSILDVAADLHGADRESFVAAAPDLLAASTAETNAAYIAVTAQVRGSPNIARLDAVVSRSGGSSRIVWRQVR